jgi:membrane-bound lytic murein transglycosylase B
MSLVSFDRRRREPHRARAVLRLRAAASALILAAGLFGSAGARADDTNFAHWLQDFRRDAQAHGISSRTLNLALADVAPIPRVIELDHRQPEFTLTFAEYLAHVVPESRVEHGQELLKENQALLDKVTAVYGVQPQFIVALWGIESDFGRIVGDFPVVPALATLAYDGRRSAYFRGELIDALLILDHGYIDLSSLRGSWAGAMGQNQFMPSSYLRYAVDYAGNGKRDIWNDRGDVFASTANYLLHEGWNANETWGRAVIVPQGFDSRLADIDIKKSIPEWNALGVRLTDGTLLPEEPSPASIVMPAGDGGPAFLVYGNFRTILKWNKSVFFATAVGLLADRIEGR